MISPAYRAQVDLLLRILPHVAKENSLALKGGTAINLFVRDMPRFSVDIDLTYLPFDSRETALSNISAALVRIKSDIERTIPGIQVTTVQLQSTDNEVKLLCRLGGAVIKIEVNTTMRGHLWSTRELQLAKTAQKEFGKFAAIHVVSDAELFGGKICAALDRQHPRDLFDVRQLFAAGGITEEIRRGFLVALLSHSRPLHEMLRPTFADQRRPFETQFAGMTLVPFDYDEFEETRERLVREILAVLTPEERAFLLSFKSGEPEWSLLPLVDLQRLPAIQWKLDNIRKLKQNTKKHAVQLAALAEALAN